MPLWKLQTIGREQVDFLYANTRTGRTIGLRPGVAFCFPKFHALQADLVRMNEVCAAAEPAPDR